MTTATTSESQSESAADFSPAEPAAGSGGYVYDPDLRRAVRVALVTGRPLLLRGAPGSGKTTLARDAARVMKRVYYQQTVTSRTEARDLEWTFDAVRRLADAQLREVNERVREPASYIVPRTLWWGFAPQTAERRGAADPEMVAPASDPGETFGEERSPARAAVVLVDEIDKAEPEVANDLLEPFDVGEFTVAETEFKVKRMRDVFLVVTTNEERDLPAAFLRRCVVYEVGRPSLTALREIARSHFSDAVTTTLVDAMVQRVMSLAKQARDLRLREPGTAEFLDGLRACIRLKVQPGSAEWEPITRLALWKHGLSDAEGDQA